MSDEKLCRAHAEWFGKLLEEILVPVARDFMAHGIKHGKEQTEAAPTRQMWHAGAPRNQTSVYVAYLAVDGLVHYVVGWYEADKNKWYSGEEGKLIQGVLGWAPLPEWEVPHD